MNYKWTHMTYRFKLKLQNAEKMNTSIRDIDAVASYSGWPKQFVKYGVGNKENKNRHQGNADFAYMYTYYNVRGKPFL
jgi:hypothetical protein